MSEQSKAALAEARGVLGGFREFLMRGNVVELAVAVVVGAAFTNIVNSVVDGVINPLIGAFGTQDLDAYQFCLKGPCEVDSAGEIVSGIPLYWGSVVSAALTFLITAAVVYFLMILPINRYKARQEARAAAEAPPQEPEQTELSVLAEIRDELVAQRTHGGGATTVAPPRTAAEDDAPRDA